MSPGAATIAPDATSSRGAAGMLLGRKTYESLAAYWSKQTGEWAAVPNSLPKFVASRTLQGPLEWNATVIEGDAADKVSRLKSQLEANLFMIGCGELARHLLANGLVDELRFWVHPTVWGEGTRPYQGDTVRMRLLESTWFDSGVTLLRYEPLEASPAGQPA
jgi:dihydrofolate reductase